MNSVRRSDSEGKSHRERSASLREPLAVNRREAARLLGISPQKLWSMTAAGELPHFRVGSGLRYRVESLRAWIEAREREAAEARP